AAAATLAALIAPLLGHDLRFLGRLPAAAPPPPNPNRSGETDTHVVPRRSTKATVFFFNTSSPESFLATGDPRQPGRQRPADGRQALGRHPPGRHRPSRRALPGRLRGQPWLNPGGDGRRLTPGRILRVRGRGSRAGGRRAAPPRRPGRRPGWRRG